jgi:hypothetical protein
MERTGIGDIVDGKKESRVIAGIADEKRTKTPTTSRSR